MKNASLRRLISKRDIRRRVRELAEEITAHYQGRPVVVLGLMNGALFFLVDLLRLLPESVIVECRTVASYAGPSSTGKIHGLDMLHGNFAGKTVLIVDDILDTGLTLSEVRARLLDMGAKRVDVCVLCRKEGTRKVRVRAKWVGFDIKNEFVVGYGLDFDGVYRTRQEIFVLEPSSSTP